MMTESLVEVVMPLPLLKKLPVQLGITGLLSWALYAGIAWQSRRFSYGSVGSDRPLLTVIALFGAVFLLYLLQVRLVLRGTDRAKITTSSSEGVVPVIVVFALAFRLLLLFSEPIQEVDAYRYLWDGQAVAAGVNPFRYSPHQVLDADADAILPDGLRRLVELRDGSPAQFEILRRVHFGELTTVYPPVSQVVFAFAAGVTPKSVSVAAHLLIIKAMITAFDLATFGILILLLRHVMCPSEWSIIYAWCPLLMKEFANSGHLDSIAVFITTAAIYCSVRGLFPKPDASSQRSTRSLIWLTCASLLLGLGVGAKVYPAIFAPLVMLSIWRTLSFRFAVVNAFLFLVVSVAMVIPMLNRDQSLQADAAESVEILALAKNSEESSTEPPQPDFEGSKVGQPVLETVASTELNLPREPQLPPMTLQMEESVSLAEAGPPLPPALNSTSTGPNIDPTSTGLSAFASQWQMNDFLFLLLFENLTPDPGSNSARTAWFVLTSDDWRVQFVNSFSQWTGVARHQTPFFVTRAVTTAIFGLMALWWAGLATRSKDATDWLRYAFLTVAWFWLLLPTQNPWYWAWAMPLLPFARSRVWILLSGLTLTYYLRFWCLYHAPETASFGTRYSGVDFFDFVGSWIEFAPWLLLLVIDFVYRKASKPSEVHPPGSTG